MPQPISPSITQLDFGATLAHNNLGAQGPDVDDPTHALRFRGIGGGTGGNMDLVVTNVTTYAPWNSASNGLLGKVAQINLRIDRKTTFQVGSSTLSLR